MLVIECEDKDEEVFRLWCTERQAYVLEGVSRDAIRDLLRMEAQQNADTWTDNLVGKALEIGEVPKRKAVVH